jgi:hypothetical protein
MGGSASGGEPAERTLRARLLGGALVAHPPNEEQHAEQTITNLSPLNWFDLLSQSFFGFVYVDPTPVPNTSSFAAHYPDLTQIG